jgi:general secretion pathway protein G
MRCRPRFPRCRGFTLIEVLLVLAILGVIAGLVAPRLMGRQQHANVDATRLAIKGVEQALKLYALDHLGELPTSQAGLEALVTPPSKGTQRWRGPYLDGQPKDAWGRPLTYIRPGKRNPQGFDVVSAGPDGIAGTTDDIVNDN